MARIFNIPKVIHQIWLGPLEPPHKLMNTWKVMHPGWDYRLWTEENLPKLQNQMSFDAITSFAGKSDILRIELLKMYGGVYIDADTLCLRPLDGALMRYHFFACYENEKARQGLIANGVIGSVQGHPLLNIIIEMISLVVDLNKADPWVIVGPMLFTQAIRKYQVLAKKVAILPSHFFYPEHFTGEKYKGRGKPYATHLWFSKMPKN